VLSHQGLSPAQIQWVESAMQVFDQGVENGTVTLGPVGNGPTSTTITALPAVGTIIPETTGGLPYSWFVSSNPYYETISKWYGTEWIMDGVATLNLISALNQISMGLSYASTLLAFIPGAETAGLLSGLASVGTATAANMMAQVNIGFGVNWDMAAGVIPFQVNSNDAIPD